MSYRAEVYKIVQQIPKGKVATYGGISESVNGKWKMETGKSRITARMVGKALHNNPDPKKIPCHRVVDRNGRVAENFAYGGWRGQRKKLVEEGVMFRDTNHVRLAKYLWHPR